jgi:hypothetical protein
MTREENLDILKGVYGRDSSLELRNMNGNSTVVNDE